MMEIKDIENIIYIIRDQKVMLDSDLAKLYRVETKVLNKAVKRNLERFPEGFMFELSFQELTNLRFQIGTSSSAHGGRRYLPRAFTEHGIVALSGILSSKIAIEVNIEIVRVFVRMRKLLASHESLSNRLDELEKGTDKMFKVVF